MYILVYIFVYIGHWRWPIEPALQFYIAPVVFKPRTCVALIDLPRPRFGYYISPALPRIWAPAVNWARLQAVRHATGVALQWTGLPYIQPDWPTWHRLHLHMAPAYSWAPVETEIETRTVCATVYVNLITFSMLMLVKLIPIIRTCTKASYFQIQVQHNNQIVFQFKYDASSLHKLDCPRMTYH